MINNTMEAVPHTYGSFAQDTIDTSFWLKGKLSHLLRRVGARCAADQIVCNNLVT